MISDFDLSCIFFSLHFLFEITEGYFDEALAAVSRSSFSGEF
tara:strand:+ start:424 stop:549 length:126 start_codon:yes stop_codon:yes gene_type:complete